MSGILRHTVPTSETQKYFKFCLDVLCMSLSFIKDLESIPSQQFIKFHFSEEDIEAEQGLWLVKILRLCIEPNLVNVIETTCP